MIQKSYQGSCLCGSITYEVTAIRPQMAHCHCSMCRKFHGAAFSTFGEAEKDHFHWIKGQHLLSSYVATNGTKRSFCSRCGSSLLFKASDGSDDVVEFALGTLDCDIHQQPDAHVFIECKANWIELNDDLPKFKEERTAHTGASKNP